MMLGCVTQIRLQKSWLKGRHLNCGTILTRVVSSEDLRLRDHTGFYRCFGIVFEPYVHGGRVWQTAAEQYRQVKDLTR